MSEPLCIGLVGGLGVGAAVHYYQELAKAHSARGRAMRLLMVHADVTRVLGYARDGEKAAMAEYLSTLIGQLAAGGAQLGVIPAVTPHLCAPELTRMSALPLVNMVETIDREIHRRGLRRVALFGTRFTVESRMFGQLTDVTVVTPTPEEIDAIHAAYVGIVQAGGGDQTMLETLRRIARRLIEHDEVEAIVLAGTELALLFNEANTDFPHVDGCGLHLSAILDRVFGVGMEAIG